METSKPYYHITSIVFLIWLLDYFLIKVDIHSHEGERNLNNCNNLHSSVDETVMDLQGWLWMTVTSWTRGTSPQEEAAPFVKWRKGSKTGEGKSCREDAVMHWSGRKRQSTDCRQDGGVTAANQISLSLGCLMSILLCDTHLATLSTMNTRSTRFSIAPLLHCQIREGIRKETKQKKQKKKEDRAEMLKTQWGSFIHVWALRITGFSPLMLKYLSARRIYVSSSPTQSLSGQIVCLSVTVCSQHKAPSKTRFRAQFNTHPTETEAGYSSD